MPRVLPCLIHLLASAILALILSVGVLEAGVFQTPAGGWGIDRPDPPPRDAVRGGARGL